MHQLIRRSCRENHFLDWMVQTCHKQLTYTAIRVWTIQHPLPPARIVCFFSLLELQKTLLSHPLKILRPKTKTPGNSSFLTTSGNSTLFLIIARNSSCNFFNTLGNSRSSIPPVCFFWNSPMKEYLNSPLSI